MSNSPDTFVDYFKIRWSRRSAWTLEQAAYLSCGKNPESKKYEIAVAATNPISRRYYWLINKLKKEYLEVVDVVNGVDYFNTGSLFRLLSEKFTIEKDMQKAFDHMYQAPFGVDYTKFVSRSIYREAGRLVFDQYPKARIMDVAVAIKDLPQFFNNEEFGHIETAPPTTIATYLKNFSGLKQKPKQDDIVGIKVDLRQLAEKL